MKIKSLCSSCKRDCKFPAYLIRTCCLEYERKSMGIKVWALIVIVWSVFFWWLAEMFAKVVRGG